MNRLAHQLGLPLVVAGWALAAWLSVPALAQDRARDSTGVFDYYILSLSWQPSWCALEGDRRGDARCAQGAGIGWSLHGLWPQHERGWPQDCATPKRDPTRRETAAMGEIMGSAGLAWHQWRKHGRCTGLAPDAYFELSIKALAKVNFPPVFERIDTSLRVDPAVIEAAFLEVNPGWTPDTLTITCRGQAIYEARLCLTKDLDPRRCGADVVRDCSLPGARLDPLR